jgi:hypothetical protein
MEYYSAMRRSEVLMNAIKWMNLENTILSEETCHKGLIPCYINYPIYMKCPEGANLERQKVDCLYLGKDRRLRVTIRRSPSQ